MHSCSKQNDICRYTEYRQASESQCVKEKCRHWLEESDVCVLELVDEKGEMKESEIAALLGISVSRVSQLLHRALKKARLALESAETPRKA